MPHLDKLLENFITWLSFFDSEFDVSSLRTSKYSDQYNTDVRSRVQKFPA